MGADCHRAPGRHHGAEVVLGAGGLYGAEVALGKRTGSHYAPGRRHGPR
ncbi:hypothetical protein [Pyxidicoccus xibeiensis]|nr:hypothetical protein [Pyxidicoccus xibeiensis]MCP3144555.1 hypothetical protein [Pyxidicoccus xibeiensis]